MRRTILNCDKCGGPMVMPELCEWCGTRYYIESDTAMVDWRSPARFDFPMVDCTSDASFALSEAAQWGLSNWRS